MLSEISDQFKGKQISKIPNGPVIKTRACLSNSSSFQHPMGLVYDIAILSYLH